MLVLLVAAAPVHAADGRPLRGVALVIGNGDYEHLPALANPARDARAVEDLLDRLGFETELSSDRDARRLRRDLEDFIEDAEGADVAILYYAGHGIEAGGENFLVPVDAGIDALADAGDRLVPLSRLVQELQATVPVAIVLLDACRDNPFPPGSTVSLGTGGEAAPVAAIGLGETRGAMRLSAPSQATEDGGIVVGFAAEPGRAALDGEPGGNSPYAAAVLRHIEAMAGEEFGVVMRMVAEEVYLKTGGRQRPWVNESLRRLLYFGEAPAAPEGDEGAILSERRQLLLTIAALPDPERRRVETVAREGGVPMDAVYAMLKALGTDAPSDPSQLDALMHQQAVRLKAMMDERAALSASDPEIVRLAALADEAIGEGAISAAIGILDRAKARVGELSKTVEQAEDDIRQRRIEFAQVHARSAEAHLLAFDFAAAADGFADAVAQVERWDDQLAWKYRDARADALANHGNYRGDNAALALAVEVAREAVRLGEGTVAPADIASTEMALGNALQYLGERTGDPANLFASSETFRHALTRIDRGEHLLLWAKLQNNLANTLTMLGERETSPARLAEAITAFEAVLPAFEELGLRAEWSAAQLNFGRALLALAHTETGIETVVRAGNALEAGLYEVDRAAAPLVWGGIQNNLGNAFHLLALRIPDQNIAASRDLQAVVAYRQALGELTRERVPLQWAIVQTNLANVLQTLGNRAQNPQSALAYYRQAVEAHENAMQEITRERSAAQWALIVFNLATARDAMAGRMSDPAEARAMRLQAIDTFRLALEEMGPEVSPAQNGAIRSSLGRAQAMLGVSEADPAEALRRLDEAAATLRGAIESLGLASVPLQWASAQHELGATLVEIGMRRSDVGVLGEARAAYEAALTKRTQSGQPIDWASSMSGIANSTFAQAAIEQDADGIRTAIALIGEVRAFVATGTKAFDAYFADRLAVMEAELRSIEP